jgi:hypothetical protein
MAVADIGSVHRADGGPTRWTCTRRDGSRTPPDLTGYVDLGGVDEAQVFVPALTTKGELCLQPGETIHTTFDTVGAGIRSGLSPVRHPGGSMEEMVGRCFVTNTRAVFVCHLWDLGGDVESATQQYAVTVLVGQVRWPWLASVSYASRAGCLDSMIELRCVQTDDRRETSVFLSLVPAPEVDVDRVVRTIVDKVRDDRLGHPALSDDSALRFGALDVPVACSRWKTVCLPGAYKRMASTAGHGGHSRATLSTWRFGLVDQIHD